ncbi:unnamed protein product [Peronospora belbahrii]|uniref:Reverse transcriptase domain-containing protein n=1 Tax=Peronospora belbahrii TaxID=622444 RepID=A0AAU9LFB2_9STRA|nr:unnamed protein product [Peronospora belbahrii]
MPVAANGLTRPLKNPITTYELERAFRRLRNGRAPGPDSTPAELLKYGSELLAQPLTNIINHGLATGDSIHLGDGILLGLPQPNMPAGQFASLRSIVLLNSIRKAISLVVLRRIFPKVERFLSPHQSGFRPSRNTTDTVWAHRWVAARAQRYRERFYILGIDLSRTFDTVNRDKLLPVLDPLLDDNEVRLIRLLLRTHCSPSDSAIACSHLSRAIQVLPEVIHCPVFFLLFTLKQLYETYVSQLNVPHDLLADMIVYADDADFLFSTATQKTSPVVRI